MTTGRINQVTIVKGKPPNFFLLQKKSSASPNRRAHKATRALFGFKRQVSVSLISVFYQQKHPRYVNTESVLVDEKQISLEGLVIKQSALCFTGNKQNETHVSFYRLPQLADKALVCHDFRSYSQPAIKHGSTGFFS